MKGKLPMRVSITFVVLLLAGCAGSTSSPPSKYLSSSPEYQLAKIDDHGSTPTDSQVGRYVSVLDELRRRCTDSRRQLADWASAIKENFTGDSEMHLLELALEQAKRVEAQGAVRSSCKEVFVLVGTAAQGGA